jgi:hypothetical protein
MHPEEQKLKDRLGKDYETETPPPGARIIGDRESAEKQQAVPAEAAGEGTSS